MRMLKLSTLMGMAGLSLLASEAAAGIGAEYAVAPNVEVFGELKYVVSDYHQAVFALARASCCNVRSSTRVHRQGLCDGAAEVG